MRQETAKGEDKSGLNAATGIRGTGKGHPGDVQGTGKGAQSARHRPPGEGIRGGG